MKKYIYILFFTALIMIVACKKGELDRFPQTSVSPQLFFNNESDLNLYVNGLLSQPDKNSYSSAEEQSTDNLATTGSVELKNIMLGNTTAQNINTGWGIGSWSRLRDINYFLENYSKAQVSDAIKNHYAGLARYYRAMFYLDKVKRFSDVPWYAGTLNPGDAELLNPRDARALVVDNIMADLDFAYKNVKEDVAKGTPGKWAVATFYSRAALYEGTFRKYHSELNLASTANTFLQIAAKVAGEIIAAKKFTIYNTGKPNQDYATLFSSPDLTSGLMANEVILTNIFDNTLGKTGTANTYAFGNYEQSPTKDLIQSYLMADGSRFNNVPNYDKLGFVDEFKKRDPRLSQTIAYPGWVRAPATTPYVQVLSNGFSGYHQLKGYINSTDNATIYNVDFPVYRYAEVLLNYAEALAELGTLTQGNLDESVNLLRQRAGLPNLIMGTANANPDPSLVEKFPNVSGNVGVILEIRRERRVEFAFENTRFDDLMRWKAGKILTKTPEGMYFKGLGKFDLTGDGVDDIVLIDYTTSAPATAELNSLGVKLVYYRAGPIGSGATIILRNGFSGGNIITDNIVRSFEEPKYYYRPIPQSEVILNPNLKQIFGW